MAIEIRQFAVTIPAGTTQAAPQVTSAVFPARTVTQIDVLFPPGPRGEVGIAVGTANVKTLPYGNSGFLVADNQFFPFPLEQQINSGSWQITAYNTGTFNHTITVTFHCSLLGAAAAATTVLDPGTLSSGPAPGTGSGPAPPPATVPPPPATPPPAAPPPVIPPGVGAPPLMLPPALPALPGAPAPAVDPDADTLLVGIPDLGQVWLLEGRSYTQVLTQDELGALLSAVDASANLSQAMHGAIYSAARASVALTLGDHVLTGALTMTHTGGH